MRSSGTGYKSRLNCAHHECGAAHDIDLLRIPRPDLLKRIAYRILRFLIFLYLAICVVFYLLQEKLIFPGAAASQGKQDSIVQQPPGCQLLSLKTPDGERVAAVFGPAQQRNGEPLADPAHAPTIVFFYGNGMCMSDAMEEFREFRKLGANVLIPEYLGYGMSSGKPSEAGCYAAADAAWQWTETQPQIDHHKIIVAGWSLGAAVAVDMAARKPVAGLAMFSAFTSMADMGSHLYPFLPVHTILKHRFENLQKIPKVACPIVLGHGVVDNMIPYSMSDELAKAAKAPIIARIRAEGASHNDFLALADDQVIAALQQLVDHAGQLP
jgi:pimeloyl-ACP methyl ester carboxylesterase